METILQTLESWVRTQPTKPVWTYLDDKGAISESYTYFELDKVTTSLAAYLLEGCALQPGDRVLLVFFPGLYFSISLLACFKAGLIAVPVFPPDPRRLKKDLHHFVSIHASSGAKVALTHNLYNVAKKVADLKSLFSSQGHTWPDDISWIKVDDVINRSKSKAHSKSAANISISHTPTMNDVAFLQYTSGSTSEPKGVMISHTNLAHNLTIIMKDIKAIQSTINVSWLPQYHDMGLIGSYLGTMFCGGSGYYLSPISFLKDPVVWVYALSKYKGTHTQAPNFAFALVVRKFQELTKSAQDKLQLDLSSMQHMINAAEPVDYAALSEFYNAFTSLGLPHGVVVPTYGLAEHTVFVCSGGDHVLTVQKAALEAGMADIIQTVELRDITAADRAVQGEAATGSASGSSAASPGTGAGLTQAIVGCGYPHMREGVDLLVVDHMSLVVQRDGQVGEVWVTSLSKASGYWNQQELSQDVFHAHPTVDSNNESKGSDSKSSSSFADDGYLRTGDLGFLHKGELFICGRIKDLIIVRGANHYPQDIERTAEKSHAALRAGCSAAFAIKHEASHTEAVVYVAEVKDNTPASQFGAIVDACRTAIAGDHGLALSCVCLLQTRSVPKTTSGKIARAWCKRGFLDGSLKILHRHDGAEEVLPADTAADQAEDSASTSAAAGGGVKDKREALNVEPGEHIQAITTREDVQNMTRHQLLVALETALIKLAAAGPAQLAAPIDPQTPLVSLGMDSMTIVQLKGVLENKFLCEVPDEFLFTPMCTLNGLAEAVACGGLSEAQKLALQQQSAAGPEQGQGQGQEGHGDADNSTVVRHRRPLCPWFTCCY